MVDYDYLKKSHSDTSLAQKCFGAVRSVSTSALDFSTGFVQGFYYQQMENFDRSSKTDYAKEGIKSLRNDKSTGGIGFSASFVGYGLGSFAGHPLTMAAMATVGYAYYSK